MCLNPSYQMQTNSPSRLHGSNPLTPDQLRARAAWEATKEPGEKLPPMHKRAVPTRRLPPPPPEASHADRMRFSHGEVP